jgi:hypothetical protein
MAHAMQYKIYQPHTHTTYHIHIPHITYHCHLSLITWHIGDWRLVIGDGDGDGGYGLLLLERVLPAPAVAAACCCSCSADACGLRGPVVARSPFGLLGQAVSAPPKGQ